MAKSKAKKKTETAKAVKKTSAGANKKKSAGAGGRAVRKKTGGKDVTFSIKADRGCAIYVAGTFNDWNEGADKLAYRNGKYSKKMRLGKGRHEYKFVINGAWHNDPECREWAHNDMGSVNSVIFVD